MMSSEDKREAKRAWSKAFADLEKYGVPHTYSARQLAGLYAVASICYDDGNHRPLIENESFDRLCMWFMTITMSAWRAGRIYLTETCLSVCRATTRGYS